MSFASQVRAVMAPPPPIPPPPIPPPPRPVSAVAPPPPPIPPPPPRAQVQYSPVTTPLVLEGIEAAIDGADLAGVVGIALQEAPALARSRPVLDAARRRLEVFDGCSGALSWFAEGHPRPELESFRARWATFGLGESPL